MKPQAGPNTSVEKRIPAHRRVRAFTSRQPLGQGQKSGLCTRRPSSDKTSIREEEALLFSWTPNEMLQNIWQRDSLEV